MAQAGEITTQGFQQMPLGKRWGRLAGCWPSDTWGGQRAPCWSLGSEEKVALFFKPSPGVGRGSPHLVPVPSVSSSPACAP